MMMILVSVCASSVKQFVGRERESPAKYALLNIYRAFLPSPLSQSVYSVMGFVRSIIRSATIRPPRLSSQIMVTSIFLLLRSSSYFIPSSWLLADPLAFRVHESDLEGSQNIKKH